MDLLIASNTVAQAQADVAPTTGTPAWATSGNPATNTPATIFPAYAFNAIQAELTAVIQAAGITLDRTKLNQVLTSLLDLFQNGQAIAANDTSTVANSIVATPSPAPAAYVDKMPMRFRAANANNGACTINWAGLGSIALAGPVGALQGGEIIAGGIYDAIYVQATNTAVLVGQTAGAKQTSAAAASNQAVNLGQNVAPANSLAAASVAAGASLSASTSFTAPCKGTALISFGMNKATISQSFTVVIDGTNLDSNTNTMSEFIAVAITGPGAQTFTATATNNGTAAESISMRLACLFIPTV